MSAISAIFSEEVRPGFCPTCWAKGKATPFVAGRCWWCLPLTRQEADEIGARIGRAMFRSLDDPVDIEIDEEDVVDVDV